MSRRGNSEGTIRKRSDGRWEARYLGTDGNRRSVYGKTRQEVVRLLAAAVRDRDAGLTALTDRQTVEQYLTSWLEKVQHQVDPSSHMRYEREIRLRLVPGLGDVQLSKLTGQQVETLYARKLKEGVTTSSVRYMHVVLHRALNDAVRLGLVHRNVCSMVDIPRLIRQEMMPLTEEQARILLEAAAGDPFEAVYVLALHTGMRRGELLALKWANVDLDNATLQVQATLQDTLGGWVIASPKTKHSRRKIALGPTVVEALRRHRVCQAEDRLCVGPAWSDQDLVFSNAVGGIMNPYNFVQRQFKALLKRANLPEIRFHDLRHTAATLLLARGVNVKVVSEMLGHSNIGITLNIYGHVLPHMQQEAAHIMDRALRGS